VAVEKMIARRQLGQRLREEPVVKRQREQLLLGRRQQERRIALTLVAGGRRRGQPAVRRIVGEAEPVAVALDVVIPFAGAAGQWLGRGRAGRDEVQAALGRVARMRAIAPAREDPPGPRFAELSARLALARLPNRARPS
jgi:hypothetical protein